MFNERVMVESWITEDDVDAAGGEEKVLSWFAGHDLHLSLFVAHGAHLISTGLAVVPAAGCTKLANWPTLYRTSAACQLLVC